jgi:hypothetical protein
MLVPLRRGGTIIHMDDLRQAERRQRLAAQAEWVWPALCITMLWGLGLLLNLAWLTTWLGAALLGVSFAVAMIVGRVRRSAVGAAWMGGAALFGLGLCAWILILTYFMSTEP